MSDLDAFLADVGQSAYGWPASLRFTYDKVRELLADDVKGELVECGVGNGVHPAAMWRATADAGEPRTIRLFDSFEGVPNGGAHDVEWNREHGDGSGRLEPTGVAMASLFGVQSNLQRWGCHGDRFVFHVGWFQDVLRVIGPAWQARYDHLGADGIAFLRLDGDLYESTLVCLQHLYPLVVPGGIVVVDDWNLDGCRCGVADYFRIAGQKVMDITLETLLGIEPITESGDVWWRKP